MNLLTILTTFFATILEASAGEQFITGLLNGLTSIASLVVNFFSGLFTGVIGLIWSNGALTIIGWLMLLGLGFAAFWFVFRWLRSLIRFK